MFRHKQTNNTVVVYHEANFQFFLVSSTALLLGHFISSLFSCLIVLAVNVNICGKQLFLFIVTCSFEFWQFNVTVIHLMSVGFIWCHSPIATCCCCCRKPGDRRKSGRRKSARENSAAASAGLVVPLLCRTLGIFGKTATFAKTQVSQHLIVDGADPLRLLYSRTRFATFFKWKPSR